MINQKQHHTMIKEDLIVKYLQNEMDGPEKKKFEERLSADKELQQLLNFHNDLKIALAENEVLLLRNQLDKIHYSLYNKSKIIRIVPKFAKIAAVATGIIAITSLLYIKNHHLNNKELYNKYFEPYESVVRVRNTESSVNLLSQAMSFYDAGKYYDAAQLFERILVSDSSKIIVNLYSGISNMEIKEYNKANKSFNHIIHNQNNHPFIEQAEWYLGFCYLMTNDNIKAYDQFEKIATSNSYYSEKAKKITRKIKLDKN